MKAILVAFLNDGIQWKLAVLISTVTIVLGVFVASSPQRAANIWGSQRLANLTPERRASFVRWYRAFGILLCLSGVLLALETIVSSNYYH